jgi:hypothetical protein
MPNSGRINPAASSRNNDPTKQLVVYFNGLSDGKLHGQERLVLRSMMRAGYEIHRLGNNWYDNDVAYVERRLPRQVRLVRNLRENSGRIALVGSSAGVADAMNVYARLAEEIPDLTYIGLCGRTAVGPVSKLDYGTMDRMAYIGTDQPSRQFVASVKYCQKNTIPKLKRANELRSRMHLFHHHLDEAVPHNLQTVPGVPSTYVPAPAPRMQLH